MMLFLLILVIAIVNAFAQLDGFDSTFIQPQMQQGGFLDQQQQPMRPTLNNVYTIINSTGPWRMRLPERFIRRQMMPFIKQFRRQLNPHTEILWLDSIAARRINLANAKETHVDLDPPEQQRWRPNGAASTRSDLGGMIVREMWRKAKTHCLQCTANNTGGVLRGRQQCLLVDPQCGFPYQLFDDRAQSIYCAVSIWKEAGLIQLRARMKCQTQPPTPYTLHSVLASNYQKNWRRMCINCVPSVYLPLRNGNNFGTGNVNGGNWNQQIGGRNNGLYNNENAANWGWNTQSNINQNYGLNGGPRRGILRVRTDQKYWRIYQINKEEGRQIANYINGIRAKIASGEAPNLPVAAGMNQIKWKPALASEALKQLSSRDNLPVNIVDLDFTYLIPGAQRGDAPQQQNLVGQGAQRTSLISGRGTNYVDLDVQSLLLWTVRNYLELFTNQQGLSCTTKPGVCKATCRKGTQRTRMLPWQRMAENPADFHCYPYELLYDRAHSIGCAVQFFTKQQTNLQAKLVCVIEHQYGRNGSVQRMMHRHNVYRVGTACTHCEHSHYCDNRTKLCVSRNARQGYDPIENVLPYVGDGLYPATNGINNGFGQRNDFVGNRGFNGVANNNGNFMLDNNNGGAGWANPEFDPYRGAFQDNGNGFGNLRPVGPFFDVNGDNIA